jgi:hypothetical protein
MESSRQTPPVRIHARDEIVAVTRIIGGERNAHASQFQWAKIGL